MNTYLLFAYESYYPGGGMNDCKGVFSAENDEQATAKALEVFKASDPRDNWSLVRLTSDSYVDVAYDFYPLVKSKWKALLTKDLSKVGIEPQK